MAAPAGPTTAGMADLQLSGVSDRCAAPPYMISGGPHSPLAAIGADDGDGLE